MIRNCDTRTKSTTEKRENMRKKIFALLRKLWERIKFERKMRRMDELWYSLGGSCFGLFPPSFYHKHSEEEVKRITEETLAKLNAILEDSTKKHSLDKAD